ncbi:ABC transporter permease [Paenibacillus algorifonticola]|uniref:ABC transporter permease n=1 Tax=Paenibacillus algorifonticola TaxID=684063 RepID=UPI003D275093
MYLALREMRFAKTRYLLIMAIMLLVSFLVLFVTGLAGGLAYANASAVENMPATHFLMQQDASQRFARSIVGEKELNTARSVIGDAKAQRLGVQMTTVTGGTDGMKTDITLFGVDMGSWLAPTVVSGLAVPNTGAGEVVVDRKLAEEGITVGSLLHDQTTGLTWTVSGFTENQSFSHTPAVFMNLRDWQQLKQQMAGRAAADPSFAAPFNAIAIQATDAEAELLSQQLEGTEIITNKQAVASIPGYKEEQGSLMMMIGFLFVISAFVLAVFFYVITIQKSSQFGILKAIGTKTFYLARSVVAQALVLAAASLAISCILVAVMQAALPASMPFQLSPVTTLYTCLLFIAMSLLGSLVSVLQVARTDALDAIGRAAG